MYIPHLSASSTAFWNRLEMGYCYLCSLSRPVWSRGIHSLCQEPGQEAPTTTKLFTCRSRTVCYRPCLLSSSLRILSRMAYDNRPWTASKSRQHPLLDMACSECLLLQVLILWVLRMSKLLPFAYVGGLGFLPKQYHQESRKTRVDNNDHNLVNLERTAMKPTEAW